jgi:hypothetical protein
MVLNAIILLLILCLNPSYSVDASKTSRKLKADIRGQAAIKRSLLLTMGLPYQTCYVFGALLYSMQSRNSNCLQIKVAI